MYAEDSLSDRICCVFLSVHMFVCVYVTGGKQDLYQITFNLSIHLSNHPLTDPEKRRERAQKWVSVGYSHMIYHLY